jgi:hypothetical protein
MIRKAGDRKDLRLKMLLYGASDTGKTYATSRLSLEYRTLILDIEGGHLSAPLDLAYADFEDIGEIVSDIEKYPSAMVKIESWHQAEQMLSGLRRNPDRFDIIVIDSLTELQKRCVDWVKSKQTTVVKELDTLTLQGWSSLAEKFRAIMRGYRDLRNHVVFTALEHNSTDDQSGIVRWMPAFDGRKTPFEVVGWMDVVGHAIKKERRNNDGNVEIERMFRFVSNGKEEAKTRGGLLSAEEAPDLNEIFRKVLTIEKTESIGVNEVTGNPNAGSSISSILDK